MTIAKFLICPISSYPFYHSNFLYEIGYYFLDTQYDYTSIYDVHFFIYVYVENYIKNGLKCLKIAYFLSYKLQIFFAPPAASRYAGGKKWITKVGGGGGVVI